MGRARGVQRHFAEQAMHTAASLFGPPGLTPTIRAEAWSVTYLPGFAASHVPGGDQPAGVVVPLLTHAFINITAPAGRPIETDLADVEDLYLYRRVGSLETSAAGLSAEEQFFDLFTDDEVKQALEDLPENFRLPVILADVEGFSYKEIAEMLDIPIGTVMSRLHRGRKAMQRALYDFAEARGLVEHTPDPVPDG